MTRAGLVVLIWAAGCALGDSSRRSSASVQPDTMGVAVEAREIPTRLRSDLVEASAAVLSATQPGILWVINDSGHEPVLFAVDTGGSDRGVWRVAGASNVDWETATMGPCGAPGNPARAAAGRPRCIFIGDVGDNGARRDAVTIYRVPEPAAKEASFAGVVESEALPFRYSDGPHDVEAMYASRSGTIFLITKRPLADSGGRRRPALVFELPAAAWGRGHRPAVAALHDSLPIVPGNGSGRVITEAALSPDGRRLAVRTYTQLYVFDTDPGTGRIRPGRAPTVCSLAGLRERQG
ncbi:MAG: hypothetical protein ACRENB_14145, partial [Gemmatimonadales bacterium]